MTIKIADTLDRLHVTAASYDGLAGGELRGRYDVRLWLTDPLGTEEHVARALADVCRSLLRLRAVAVARAKAATGSLAARSDRAVQVQRFDAALTDLHTSATSADGLVGVSLVGVDHIAFDVRPGAVQAGAERLGEAATDAAQRAVTELVTGIRQIRREAG